MIVHACGDFIDFTLGGEDEMEEAFAEVVLDGDRPTFELWHYHGDEYAFHCERRR
ncbi:MAG: hypothetical protein M3338_03615 [Actinomycetota bacterium]|nr:hypothetical protein [Actinomycetota bacterium]